jgi:hypothetical protein
VLAVLALSVDESSLLVVISLLHTSGGTEATKILRLN